MHTGAAESLAAVLADVRHRTDNGRLPDLLESPSAQAKVVAFLESIDTDTVPFVSLSIRRQGSTVFVGFDSIVGERYLLEGKILLTDPWEPLPPSVLGTGQRLEIPVDIAYSTTFLRLVQGP